MRYWKDEKSGCNMCEPNCAEEWCDMIWQLGCDYDGCQTTHALKDLIDELVKMANEALDCIYAGKITPDSPEVAEESARTRREMNRLNKKEASELMDKLAEGL